jgi:hypothetical protein
LSQSQLHKEHWETYKIYNYDKINLLY